MKKPQTWFTDEKPSGHTLQARRERLGAQDGQEKGFFALKCLFVSQANTIFATIFTKRLQP